MKVQHHIWVNFFSALVVIMALSVLTGWAFDIYFLKSLSFNKVSMKPNAAICFLICGCLLTGVLKKHKMIECMLSLFVSAIGFITLLEYIFKADAGIDQLIFKDDLNAIDTSSLERMSPITAFNFLIIGLCLFNIEKKNQASSITHGSGSYYKPVLSLRPPLEPA